MDRLLRQLDSVLDARMLGAAWFEDGEEKFDVEQMANKLGSITYSTQLSIQDLIQICRVFFGADFDEFVEIVENKKIKLRKNPQGVVISDIYIYPYQGPDESNRFDESEREAILAFNPVDARRRVISMASSQAMVLELCKHLMRNSDKKLDLVREIQNRFQQAERAKAEQQQKEYEDMKKNRARLIRRLTDESQAFKTWIKEVKICQETYAKQLERTKNYHSPSGLVSEVLTLARNKINQKD
jgi:hypothetical protein